MSAGEPRRQAVPGSTSAPMGAAEKALRAGSFGSVAGAYDRGRPGYPAAAMTWLLGPEPLHVLDLGAGTGKLTAAVLAAGHRVTALEPSPEMRAVLVANLPDAAAIDGRAEHLPLADRSLDAVVAGSAFHWFEQDAALAEIARVLRPPGVFGLLGNRFDTSLDWARHLRRLTGSPAIKRRHHWPANEVLEQHFAEVEERNFPHSQPVTLVDLQSYVSSMSRVATMSPPEREAEMARIAAFWDEEPELTGRSEATLRWRTPVRRSRVLR